MKSIFPQTCGASSPAYKRRKQMEADKQRRKLSPYLFTDEQGQLIHPDTFTKRLRKIYDAIGFPQE